MKKIPESEKKTGICLNKRKTPPTRSERSERTNTYTLLRGNRETTEKQENKEKMMKKSKNIDKNIWKFKKF